MADEKRDRQSGEFSHEALLIRLDERVAAITKVLDKQDERINEFAEAMSQTAMSLRDVVAMQRILSEKQQASTDRIAALEERDKEQKNQDARIRQQRLVLYGTMFTSMTALLAAVISAWISVMS